MHPLHFPLALLRSMVATRKLTGRMLPVRVRIGARQTLRVQAHRSAKIRLRGLLMVNAWGGSNLPSSLYCGAASTLEINGDFELGPNVHVQVHPGATLAIEGRQDASASGITSDTKIMVEKHVQIGADSIIAWDVFISDSDWHDIEGSQRVRPVSIGRRVWIAHGVSVLKGANIPAGCIVGARSVVRGPLEGEGCLLAGSPARVVRSNMKWKR